MNLARQLSGMAFLGLRSREVPTGTGGRRVCLVDLNGSRNGVVDREIPRRGLSLFGQP